MKNYIYPLIAVCLISIYECYSWFGTGKYEYHANLSLVTLVIVVLAIYFINKELKTRNQN
jgi:hypothetical protein